MNTYTLLIKTDFFPMKTKSKTHLLASYVIDYAYCTGLLLEQMNLYRYSSLHSYYLGSINPNKVKELISNYDVGKFFFCNKRKSSLTNEEVRQIYLQPENYAVVVFNCFT